VTQQPEPGEGGGSPEWGAPPQWGAPGQAQPPPGSPPSAYGTPPGYGAPPGYGPPSGPNTPFGAGPPTGWRPRPGIVPLRPLGLGEIYDGSFQAIRTNPRTMLGISAIVMVIVAVIGLVPQFYFLAQTLDLAQLGERAAQSEEFDPTMFAPLGAALGGLMLSTLVKWLASTALSALLVTAVSEAVLGRRMPPAVLWQRVKPRLWGVLGVSLLSGLMPLVAFGVTIAVVVALGFGIAAVTGSTGAAVAISVILGLVIVIGVTVYLGIALSLAAPALLLEGVGPIAALRRSWRLCRGSWWRLFGILVLTSIVVGVLSSVISVPLTQGAGAIVSAGAGSTGTLIAGAALNGLAELVTGTVFTPFSAAVTALLYIDRRMRAEGLDVQLLRALGQPG